MDGLVSACFSTGIPLWHRTMHPGQLNLSHPSVDRHDEYPAKAGTPRDALAHIRGLAVLAGIWLRTSLTEYGKQ